jgi:hypothetical protein
MQSQSIQKSILRDLYATQLLIGEINKTDHKNIASRQIILDNLHQHSQTLHAKLVEFESHQNHQPYS